MGASKREFMQVRMSTEHYMDIPPHVREEMEVKYVDEEGHDYSTDSLWCELKEESDSIYARLKKREFELRHK